MLVVRSMNSKWLSNSWLVGDRPGGHAVLIDSGGPMEPIRAALDEQRLTLTHVLCTHHHYDHVLHNDAYREAYGCPVCGHARETELFGGLDQELGDGDEIESGELRVRALHVPGHTVGQLSFLVNEEQVFTGDTLFRGSVGGTRGPGHASFEELRHSILEVLLALPGDTLIRPGHMESTRVADELDGNPFVRAWRGLDGEDGRSCRVFDQSATLLLEAEDYDGGTKCWVRFEDASEDVVPGSRVQLRS